MVPGGYQKPVRPYLPDRPASDFDPVRVSEGFCLVIGHGRLGSVPELPDIGWCEECRVGFTLGGRGITVYLRPMPAETSA